MQEEINTILSKFGGPHFIDQWYNQPCPMFENHTPKWMLDNSRGEEVLERLKSICGSDDNSDK